MSKVIVVPSRRWDEQAPGVRRAIQHADFAVCDDGTVIKDRDNEAPRKDQDALAWARRTGKVVSE